MKSLKKKKSIPQRPGIGYSLTEKECSKCGSKLYSYLADGGIGELYLCGKCGYSGPIGLNPKSKKKFQEAVKDMKNFMKSKK
jgi:ribosomal protein S27AE